jgi:quinolinate synthase
MKRNTMEKLRDCLANLEPQIRMSADLIARARKPIDRMLALSV